MSSSDDDLTAERAAMVREVERSAAHLAGLPGAVPISAPVLAALASVPRHAFVPPEHASDAYRNRPVPIGYGQTISQPFIVALMTELLQLKPDMRVLEVGTGCGYQTAILARLARDVFTIEICAPLAERAALTLASLGIDYVRFRTGDGFDGWSDAAPFDAILVAAAPTEIPPALIAQLRVGGRLVIPVGGGKQKLIVVEKQSDQSTVLREILPVCFVPLTRQHPS